MNVPKFGFFSAVDDVVVSSCFVAVFSKKVHTSGELILELSRLLKFPSYAGKNWNAVYDCLRDFEWIEEREVVLIHEIVPDIPVDDLKLYLEVLSDSVSDWENFPEHKFSVHFSARDRGAIELM